MRLSDLDHLKLAVVVKVWTLATVADHPKDKWLVLNSGVVGIPQVGDEKCGKHRDKEKKATHSTGLSSSSSPSWCVSSYELMMAVLVEYHMVISSMCHTG